MSGLWDIQCGDSDSWCGIVTGDVLAGEAARSEGQAVSERVRSSAGLSGALGIGVEGWWRGH